MLSLHCHDYAYTSVLQPWDGSSIWTKLSSYGGLTLMASQATLSLFSSENRRIKYNDSRQVFIKNTTRQSSICGVTQCCTSTGYRYRYPDCLSPHALQHQRNHFPPPPPLVFFPLSSETDWIFILVLSSWLEAWVEMAQKMWPIPAVCREL